MPFYISVYFAITTFMTSSEDHQQIKLITIEIHLEIVGLLQDSLLILDPGDCLAALDVECLDALSRFEIVLLAFRLLCKMSLI